MAVARAYLAVLAATALGAVISGWFVEQHLWTAQPSPEAVDHYNALFTAHSWLPFAALLPAVFAGLAGAGQRVHPLAWGGFAMWCAAIALAAWIALTPGDGWAGLDVRVTVLRLTAWASGLVAMTPLAIQRRGGASEWILIGAIGVACVLGIGSIPILANLVVLVAAIVIALDAVRTGSGLPCVMYAGSALIATLGYALSTLLIWWTTDEGFIADSYAVTGAVHLFVAAGAFALLAAVHARGELVGRVPQRVLATIGAGVISLGSSTMIVAMIGLGANGMPRRYASYLPMYANLHHAVAIGAGILMLGLVLAALAWAFGRRYVAARDASVHAHS